MTSENILNNLVQYLCQDVCYPSSIPPQGLETVQLSPKTKEDNALSIDLKQHMRGEGGRWYHDPYFVFVVDTEAYPYDDEVIKKFEAMGKPGFVSTNAKDDSFIFTMESAGALKASQMLLNAIWYP